MRLSLDVTIGFKGAIAGRLQAFSRNIYTTDGFTLRGILFERQKQVVLKYKGKEIGKHRIDLLVEDKVIVELKAVDTMNKIYEAQLLTYLKAMSK